MVCSKFEVLPEMIRLFNTSMYDHKCPQIVVNPGAGVNNEADDDKELPQVLNDVEELFGDPVLSLHIERSGDCVKQVRDRNEEMFCFKNRFTPPHRIFILKKDLNAPFIDQLAPFSAYLSSHIAKNHKQNTNFQGRK